MAIGSCIKTFLRNLKADKRKARKNNGAKRDMHYEMEQEEHDVYPDDPDFDINKARLSR